MKCDVCGFEATTSIDKCIICETPFEKHPDYNEVQIQLDYWADDIGTINVENHSELIGELERINSEIKAMLEIYGEYS